MMAFLGKTTIKADVLAAIAASTSYQDPAFALLKYGIQNDEFDAVAKAAGLPPEFARLAVRTMARSDAGEGQFRWDQLAAFMAAIEPGTDLSKVAHHWVIWAWEAAPEPLCSWLHGSPVLASGEAVVAMHRRIVQGESVDSQEWRAVRRIFPQEAPATVPEFAAAAIAATAWDFSKVPGAAVDLMIAWRDLYEAKYRTELAWTRELDEEARLERVVEFNAVYAAVGEQLAGESDAAFKERKFAALEAHHTARGADPNYKQSALQIGSHKFYEKFFGRITSLNKEAAAGLVDAVKLSQRDFVVACA